MGLLERLFGGKRDGAGADGADVESAVATLVTMYEDPEAKADGGFSITGRQAEEVRALGRNIHKAGGKARMVEVHHGVRDRLPYAASNLDAIWASLPQWKE